MGLVIVATVTIVVLMLMSTTPIIGMNALEERTSTNQIDSISGSTQRHSIKTGWVLQSSAVLPATVTGTTISQRGFDTRTWYSLTSFPATVLAGLMQHSEYPDLFASTNMEAVDPARFDCSWWYRTEIPTATLTLDEVSKTTFVTLIFHGINYRANVYLNGALLASNTTLRGTFRRFELDISDAFRASESSLVLAVEVFRPYDIGLDKNLTCRGRNSSDCLDLAISWVDWAPTPPDVNMGLWRDVEIEISDSPVDMRFPQVATTLLPSGSASLQVLVSLLNRAATPVPGDLAMHIVGRDGVVASCSSSISVSASTTSAYTWNPEECASLIVPNPPLWWPWQMGSPTLVNLTITFSPTEPQLPAAHFETRVGLREVTKTIDANENAEFRVNGKRILIRGGGWAPDLLQRMTPERHAQELAYVRHLGLNAVRLEGKLQDDALFSQVFLDAECFQMHVYCH